MATEQAKKYLKLARIADKEGNGEDAKKYYDMLRTEDPDNGEAHYFFQYYALKECKNIEIANRFRKLCLCIPSAIDKVAESSDSDEEKVEAIAAITYSFIPLTLDLNQYMNGLRVPGDNTKLLLPQGDIKSIAQNGIPANYALGDRIEKHFKSNAKAMKCAAEAWKKGVAHQQKWYAEVKDKTLPEKYTLKIQKIDPSYVMPKKAGCISIG